MHPLADETEKSTAALTPYEGEIGTQCPGLPTINAREQPPPGKASRGSRSHSGLN